MRACQRQLLAGRKGRPLATSYLPNQLAASNAPPSGHGTSLSGVILAGDTADGPLLRAV